MSSYPVSVHLPLSPAASPLPSPPPLFSLSITCFQTSPSIVHWFPPLTPGWNFGPPLSRFWSIKLLDSPLPGASVRPLVQGPPLWWVWIVRPMTGPDGPIRPDTLPLEPVLFPLSYVLVYRSVCFPLGLHGYPQHLPSPPRSWPMWFRSGYFISVPPTPPVSISVGHTL